MEKKGRMNRKKINLTQDNIVADLCSYTKLRYGKTTFIGAYLGSWAFLTVPVIILVSLHDVWMIMLVPAAIASIPLLLCVGWWVYHCRRACKTIRAGGYSITSEKLTSIDKKFNYGSRSDGNFCNVSYIFGSEEYRMPIERYTWLSRDELSMYDRYSPPEIGDEFWVARDSETTEIGAIYPKKYFDYET